MKEKLIMLKNTLFDVETRGASTIIMSDCIKYLSQLIAEFDKNEGISE